MPAYSLADVNWFDQEAVNQDGKLALPTLAAAGGKILAAASQAEVLEGNWRPNLLVRIFKT